MGVVSVTVTLTVQQGRSLLGTHRYHKHTNLTTCILTQAHTLSMQIMHLETYTLFSSVFFHIFILTKAAFHFQLGYNAWAVAYICYPPLSLLHNISKTPNRMKAHKAWKHWLGYCYFGGCYPPFKGFKVEQKDTGWLTFFGCVYHNKILSYSLSTWINIVALVLLTLCCVHWRLALGSGLCWSSNGFVKYLWSLNCVLKWRWGFSSETSTSCRQLRRLWKIR